MLNLFLFPFGGGNETSYTRIIQLLHPSVRVITGEGAGKGRRSKEPLLRNLYQMADDFYEQYLPELKEPYVFFGHSMGAYLAYLTAIRIQDEKRIRPKHLILSSKIAPLRHYNKKRALLTNEAFIAHLKELEGMPDAILSNRELLEHFLPIIRADFDALDQYKYFPSSPLDIPISLFCGTQEQVPDEWMTDWKKETTGPFHFERITGGHFWLFDHPEPIIQCIHSIAEIK
ncbi:MAG: alpha/beta fold hydrolase [Flavobacteriales bacterium]|nr:alpha/beta fold hydrolase [Flavobacteriales bacterium]